MAREAFKGLLNTDDFAAMKRHVVTLGAKFARKGYYRFSYEPAKPARSLRQNAWYHSCIVEPLYDFLKEQDYEIACHEDAHRILACKFLTVDVINPATGEVIGTRIRSTTELTTSEFYDYCERCRAWLLDFFGIVTQEPEPVPALRDARAPRPAAAQLE